MSSVAIIAATFHGNRGAEAMLSTAIGVLSERGGPQLRFEVFSYYPTVDRQLVNDPRVRIFSSTPAHLVLVLLPGAALRGVLGAHRLQLDHRRLARGFRAIASFHPRQSAANSSCRPFPIDRVSTGLRSLPANPWSGIRQQFLRFVPTR